MATRITQQNLLVGADVSSTAFTPAGESLALTLTVTELVADSVVRMVVINDRTMVQASVIVNGTGAKKIVVGKLDGEVTVRVEQLQGSGQVLVADPTGGAVEEADLADNSVTNAKMATDSVDTDEIVALAVDTAELAALAVTTAKLALLAVDTGQIAAGALDLTAPGLALIVDDYFDTPAFAAGAGGKFAADCLEPASVLNIFEADSCDGAACANMFLNGAIPVAKVAGAPFSLESVIADPGVGAAFVVTASGTAAFNIVGGADDRDLPIPAAAGLAMLLVHNAGANAGTVTSAQALDVQGTTVLNFVAELGQWVLLVAVTNGAALRWKVLDQGGLATTTHTPAYVANPHANVATGNAISVAADVSRMAITTAGGGENRTLADPAFEGQRITLESVAANAANTVTCASPFDALGATVLAFKGGVNEQITFEARMVVAALEWRVAVDEDNVAAWLVDVGTGVAIPVTRMHTEMSITTAAGETNTLADPLRAGQTMLLSLDVRVGGDRAITAASDIDSAGNNVITTSAAGDAIFLKAILVAGAPEWRLVNNDGHTLS